MLLHHHHHCQPLWSTIVLIFALGVTFTGVNGMETSASCHPSAISSTLPVYALEPHQNNETEVALCVYPAGTDLTCDTNKYARMGPAKDHYRIFFRGETVLIVQCAEDKKNCGFFEFTKELLDDGAYIKQNKDDVIYVPFVTTSNETTNQTMTYPVDNSTIYVNEVTFDDPIDMEKIFLVNEKDLYLNNDYHIEFAGIEWHTVGIMKNNDASRHKDLVKGCFEDGQFCGYDPGLNKVYKFNNPTLYYYNRMRFFYNETGFYLDDFFNDICFGFKQDFYQVAPFLSINVGKMGEISYIKEHNGKFKAKPCPTKEESKFGEKYPMSKPESDYDIDGNFKVLSWNAIENSTVGCTESNPWPFYAFIPAAVVAVLLTAAAIAVVIIVCIAKKKFIAQGKQLPKKPWQTQEEAATTFMDQTVGVTEATTAGGDKTSAYTTVA